MSVNPSEIQELVASSLGAEALNAEEAKEITSFAAAPSPVGLAEKLVEEKPVDPLSQGADATDIRSQLASMGLPGKMKIALFGNSVCRTILIRDANKLVQQLVMKNPKLSLKEVEEFSRNPHLSDFVLRSIADSKMWMKSGTVKFNIVTNAKTPQDVALKWLRYLQGNEIQKIAKSKNIPQLIATSAKKLANRDR